MFCAFFVVLGTLALQGLTLRPLMQMLRLPPDNSVQEEIRLARHATARAAMQVLRAHGESEPATVLLREYSRPSRRCRRGRRPRPGRWPVATQRQTLQQLRHAGTIGDDAFHAIEEELDIIELTADPRVRTLDDPAQAGVGVGVGVEGGPAAGEGK